MKKICPEIISKKHTCGTHSPPSLLLLSVFVGSPRTDAREWNTITYERLLTHGIYVRTSRNKKLFFPRAARSTAHRRRGLSTSQKASWRPNAKWKSARRHFFFCWSREVWVSGRVTHVHAETNKPSSRVSVGCGSNRMLQKMCPPASSAAPRWVVLYKPNPRTVGRLCRA